MIRITRNFLASTISVYDLSDQTLEELDLGRNNGLGFYRFRHDELMRLPKKFLASRVLMLHRLGYLILEAELQVQLTECCGSQWRLVFPGENPLKIKASSC